MIKAVFIDIDGTLTNEQKIVTERTKREIQKCIQKGIKIILASGRSRKETREYQQQVGASPYIISSNGASCYDIEKEKEIYHLPLPKQFVQQLLDYANTNTYKIKLNYQDKLVLNTASYPDEKDKEKSIEELYNIIQKEDIVQCVISNPNIEKMQEFKTYLAKKLPQTKIVNESKKLKNPELQPSKNYYCDITSQGVAKGVAVLAICQYLALEKDEIVTIGDGENDISMFQITPNSIAMKNALEEVKAHAHYVTKSNEEEGVAVVLEKLSSLPTKTKSQ